VDIKICKKKKRCGHFLIERLVRQLGGLGNNDFKIKSREDFKDWEKKIEKLGQEVKKFEDWIVEFFDIKGYYPCCDPQQICWGRHKYQGCKKKLEKTDISKMEVIKR